MSTEKDPTGADRATTVGVKMDAGKPPLVKGLLKRFPRACMAIAGHSAIGLRKYPKDGWDVVPDGENRYEEAEVRHIVKTAIEGDLDSDPSWAAMGEDEVLHATAQAWNAVAHLELVLRRREDNRPTKRPSP